MAKINIDWRTLQSAEKLIRGMQCVSTENFISVVSSMYITNTGIAVWKLQNGTYYTEKCFTVSLVQSQNIFQNVKASGSKQAQFNSKRVKKNMLRESLRTTYMEVACGFKGALQIVEEVLEVGVWHRVQRFSSKVSQLVGVLAGGRDTHGARPVEVQVSEAVRQALQRIEVRR